MDPEIYLFMVRRRWVDSEIYLSRIRSGFGVFRNVFFHGKVHDVLCAIGNKHRCLDTLKCISSKLINRTFFMKTHKAQNYSHFYFKSSLTRFPYHTLFVDDGPVLLRFGSVRCLVLL